MADTNYVWISRLVGDHFILNDPNKEIFIYSDSWADMMHEQDRRAGTQVRLEEPQRMLREELAKFSYPTKWGSFTIVEMGFYG